MLFNQYPCIVLSVHDGDTVKLLIDMGFGIAKKDKFRFARINAPELPTPAGKAAQEFLALCLDAAVAAKHTIYVQTIKVLLEDKQEKYGRYLAELFIDSGTSQTNLNDLMVSSGHAIYQKYTETP